jgi:hypothetical protein
VVRSRKWIIGMLSGAALVIGAGALGLKVYRDKVVVTLPDYPPIKQAIWLDQGWTADDQHWFHHVDQGTQTLNIPYEWFIAVEQPRISLIGDVGRLSDPAYLDRYGFIPGATRGGENQLPIGFARGDAMRLPDGSPWINPRTGQPMTGLGFTCAACHTGRLTYRQTTLLVDGGPALTDLGKFRQGLGISILFTKYVPGRFDRFAKNVIGEDITDSEKAELRRQLDGLWDRLNIVRKLDKKVEDASVEEGYGRLDALNRIGNQVFGLDLGEEGREKNYNATTAPVNFPHIWNTSWFDWVQYNASIMQPMVRNAGEALGVSAPVNLVRPDRLFASGVKVRNLARIEKQIAGGQPDAEHGFTGLKAPRWPERIFDQRDSPEPRAAARGAQLYDELCKGCHLPPVGSKEFWTSKNWLPPSPYNQRHLHATIVDIARIGTDEAQAKDMKDRKVWAPAALGLSTDAFGLALGEVVEKAVNYSYDHETPPVPPRERDELNGLRPNKIQDPLAYRARPLNGVWATPPFLHNGSVPNIYALLSPASERPQTFYVGRREFDPVCVGYRLIATEVPREQPDLRCLGDKGDPEAGQFEGGFKFDTRLRGNRNTGHEFNDGARGNGIIGRKLTADERLALIAFLKTDCVIGWTPTTSAADRTTCDVVGYPEGVR